MYNLQLDMPLGLLHTIVSISLFYFISLYWSLYLDARISLCMSKQNSLQMKEPYNASPLSRRVILFPLLDWFSSGRRRLYQSTGSNFERMTCILRLGGLSILRIIKASDSQLAFSYMGCHLSICINEQFWIASYASNLDHL